MSRFYYDFHIHSCLSPCGDNDSTPDSIAGMGELNGLDIMALCDHNSAKNTPAFFKACERHGIVAVAGMELTTAEDIHVVCLFKSPEDALLFEKELESFKIPYKNKEEIFGNQLICDENDEIIGKEENLLINATLVSIDDAREMCERFSGVCYPAHIDRESNGVMAVLGAFPDGYKLAELHDFEKLGEYMQKTGLSKESFLHSSDAHYLWDIKEQTDYIELDVGKDADADEIREKLFCFLRGVK